MRIFMVAAWVAILFNAHQSDNRYERLVERFERLEATTPAGKD